MVEERKKMDLEGLPAPALGVEERSDEAPIPCTPLGRGAEPLVAESVPTTSDSMGEEGRQLRGHASHCVRRHHASTGRGIGIGSKYSD